MKPKPYRRTVKIPGINEPKNIQKFEHFLPKSFKCEKIADSGEYVLAHWKIHGVKAIDAIVYTSNKIFISGSPMLKPEEFDRTATRIAEIAQNSVTDLSVTRPVTLQRAANILDYASKLNSSNEFERMLIVILADTSNEVVLTEQMKALGIRGSALGDGIPNKIDYIKKKGKDVYNEEGIKNIRELRNGIVHDGNIPTSDQADKSREIALGVLNST